MPLGDSTPQIAFSSMAVSSCSSSFFLPYSHWSKSQHSGQDDDVLPRSRDLRLRHLQRQQPPTLLLQRAPKESHEGRRGRWTRLPVPGPPRESVSVRRRVAVLYCSRGAGLLEPNGHPLWIHSPCRTLNSVLPRPRPRFQAPPSLRALPPLPHGRRPARPSALSTRGVFRACANNREPLICVSFWTQ